MKLMTDLPASALITCSGLATAAEPSLDSQMSACPTEWAHMNWEIYDPSARASATAQVVSKAEGRLAQYPGRAGPLVWEAIASSTEAVAKGRLGGFAGEVCPCATWEAERINPQALGDESVYTGLGSRYALASQRLSRKVRRPCFCFD